MMHKHVYYVFKTSICGAVTIDCCRNGWFPRVTSLSRSCLVEIVICLIKLNGKGTYSLSIEVVEVLIRKLIGKIVLWSRQLGKTLLSTQSRYSDTEPYRKSHIMVPKIPYYGLVRLPKFLMPAFGHTEIL
jgi:hypothetical protein